MDLFGHVNNVAFFRYIQAARVEYCEQIGLTSLNNNEQLSFMVASSQCQFRKPLRFPGTIEVFVRVEWIKNSSLQLEYEIWDQEKNIVAFGQDVIVVFDHHKKEKVVITSNLRDKICKREENESL